MNEGFTLRPYQLECVNAVLTDLRSRRAVVAVMATGGGKTPTAIEIMRQMPGPTLCLAHRGELLDQARDKMAAFGIVPDLEKAEARASLKSTVVLASVQSLQNNRLARFPSEHFNFIWIDECHHSVCESYLGILDHFASAKVFGCTATLDRLDGEGYEGLFEKISYEKSLASLIAEGWLSRIKARTLPVKIDLREVRRTAGDFNVGDLSEAIGKELEKAADEVVKNIIDRNRVLVFTPTIHEARIFAELCAARGVPSEYVSGACTDRDEKIIRFREGATKLLANCMVLTEGFDCPEIDTIVLLRPTQSRALLCLDEQTEVLTPEGWRYDVEIGQQVAAFNPGTETITFVPVTGKVRRNLNADEYFLSLKGQSCDIRITNKHRLLYDNARRLGWKIAPADKVAALTNGAYLPVSGHGNFKGVPLTDDEIRFVGWVMTDGCINKQKHGQFISISQSEKQPWFGEIERVLASCGLKYGKRKITSRSNFTPTADRYGFTVCFGKPRGRDKHLRGYAHLSPWLSKTFAEPLMDIDERQFSVLLEALHLANGNKQDGQSWTRRSYHISSGHKLLIERLQIAAIQRGYRASIAKNPPSSGEYWTIHLKKQSFVKVGSSWGTHATWNRDAFDSSEKCWCVENEIGTLVTRRNGKVAIVGNCQQIGRVTRLWPGKEFGLVLDFFWLTARHRLCVSSDLAGVEKEAVVDASELPAGGERRSLAEKLRNEGTDRQEDFDPLANVPADPFDVDAWLTADHLFSAPYLLQPPTVRQLETLVRLGIQPAYLTNRGIVNGTFDILKVRWNRNLATIKQARYLLRLGHEKPWRATFEEANRYITQRRSGTSSYS